MSRGPTAAAEPLPPHPYWGPGNGRPAELQSEIEEFLVRNYPNLYLASEVAEVAGISKGSALRQLKKLVAKGKAVSRDGRYGSARGNPPKPRGKIQEEISTLSGLTGIPPSVIGDWAEDVKARAKFASEEEDPVS